MSHENLKYAWTFRRIRSGMVETMKIICKSLLLPILFLIMISGSADATTSAAKTTTSAAKAQTGYGVYIGNDNIDDIIAKSYNDKVVVIEAQSFTKKQIQKLKNTGKTIYTYLNIGSIETYRPYYKQYKEYALKVYENWEDERWVDVSKKKWQKFIGVTLPQKFIKKGVDGFFVDNCDVYYHYKNNKTFKGLNRILKSLRRFKKTILINGGDVYVSRLMKEKRLDLIDGVNQETVFSAITDYDKNVFDAQKKSETTYYQKYLSKLKKKKKTICLLEYTREPELKKKIRSYCKKQGYGCCISEYVDLTGERYYPHKKLIIDTDTGADDAAALILAASCRSVDILGITTLAGNVSLEQSATNALAVLDMIGADVPVYKGADTRYDGEKIDAFSVFGEDGMGNVGLVKTDKTAQQKDAISFILETIAADPGEIEIVALGPVTNIAGAIRRDPETMKKVKMIWSMGTAGLGPGNASPVAEFNAYQDAEAYKAMLDSDIPVTIVGLDISRGDAMWTGAQFDKLSQLSATGDFIKKSFDKIREFYAKNGSPDSVTVCDPEAMLCCLDPDFTTETMRVHGSCITEPGETYGQVIFYKEGFTYDKFNPDLEYNQTLVTEVKRSEFFDRFYSMIFGTKSSH